MKNVVFIKKVFSLLLTLSLLFVFVACSNGGEEPSTVGTEPSSEAETAGDNEEVFVKPENYATVLTVTINPQFRLYLDADGIVLAVESVNKDAEEVKEELSFEKDNYESVVEKIITKSEEKGYVKKDAVINVEITETKDTTVNTVEILDKITVTVNQTAAKLELTVEIKTEDKSAIAEQPTEGATESTEQLTTTPTEPQKTDPTEATTTVPTQCSHTYKAATCTAPKTCSKCGTTEGAAAGHNWSDATCTTPKICKTCKATEGKAAGHSYKDATCTAPKTCAVCGATEGSAAGHNWSDATCTIPKTCSVCGATEGESREHTYQNGVCSCGARQLGFGIWRAIQIDGDFGRRVNIAFDAPGMDKSQLFNVETAEPGLLALSNERLIHQGNTYLAWYHEGCVCFIECTDDTVTIYLGTREKPESWPDIIKLRRSSGTEMVVTEATGEGYTYFGVQPGWIFTYQA